MPALTANTIAQRLIDRALTMLPLEETGRFDAFAARHRREIDALAAPLVRYATRDRSTSDAVERRLEQYGRRPEAILSAWRNLARKNEQIGMQGASILRDRRALHEMSSNANEMALLSSAYQELTRSFPIVNPKTHEWRFMGAQEGPVPREDPAAEPATSDILELDELLAYLRRMRQAETTIDEYKETFRRFRESLPLLRAWATRQPLAALRQRFPKIKAKSQAEFINQLLDALAQSFELPQFGFIDIMSFSRRDDRPKIEQMADKVEKTTQADIDKLAEERAKQRGDEERYQAEEEARRARANAPVTLEDFELALSIRGRNNLTPDELRRYEELRAEKDFAAQKRQAKTIQAADLPGTAWELVESFHTKQNTKIWVVKRVDDGAKLPSDLFRDLSEKAHALRGRYSSYRGQGAIPGFVFFDKGAAEKFLQVASGQASVDNAAEIAATEKFKAERRADRLEERAESITEQAEGELSRDRKTNTRTRLAEAQKMEGRARRDLRIARALESIAERIKDGSAKFLSRISNRAQLEALETLLVRAKYRRPYDEPEREGPIRLSDVDRVTYPWPSLHRSVAQDVVQAAERTSGAKQAGKKLERMIRYGHPDKLIEFRTTDELDIIDTLASRLHGRIAERVKGELAEHRRLQKMGLTTEVILRAALREYLQCCRGEASKPNPIRELERHVVLENIPGFFPTPEELADEVVAKAELAPGMRVLEPSAGRGDLAEAILAGEPDVQLDVIERQESLRRILEAKGLNLVARDFLDFDGGPYDAIVMNPPFEEDQDIDHVRHAFELVKPGGVVVSIMSAGSFPSQAAEEAGIASESGRRKRREFQAWLQSLGATWERNERGAFMSSARPTGVNTVTVVIRKPAEEGMPRAPLTDEEFAQTYRITSTSSRIYTRTMLLNAATRDSLAQTLGVTRGELADVIDDDAWMRPFGGGVPSWVIKEAVLEALVRRKSPPPANDEPDFYPFGKPPEPVVLRVSTEKAGPRSTNRDDRASAAYENKRSRRTPPKSRSKVR